ncbi:MAG: excinuclease ABC subunit UvrA [Candidatus Omnitrophica bacterium]|nr:excinuclease ABC subunit UvrA [Candidatus Omnitrophota bacterium]MBU1922870.1 excinuclease ABC subunit UvrA [Candidatus Omnitrophota bacterium]
MKSENIIIRGAREHNLKSINLDLPRNKLIVITGLSGSGKSSLAFDTIYAEGQRRFVESLSSYARQFLEQLQKPDVDYISGLSPAIAIEQRSAGGNPRSTVATQTEIYDYLRLLFARMGRVHCYKCGQLIQSQSAQEIVESIMSTQANNDVQILAGLIQGKKGVHKDIFLQIQKSGFVRARVDGKIYELPAEIKLARYKLHNIEVVVDRLNVKPDVLKRLTDSVETALKVGKGTVIIAKAGAYRDSIFSEKYACVNCGINYAEINPRNFSFNSPYGACPGCNGLGTKLEFDPDLIIPDKNKSINAGALEPWKRGGRGYILYYRWLIRELSHRLNFSLDEPFKKLPKSVQKAILYGADELIGNWPEGHGLASSSQSHKPFEGVIPHLERLFHQTDSDYLKEEISRFMSSLPCPACKGARLKPESLSVRINQKNIWEITRMPIKEAINFFSGLKLTQKEKLVSYQALKEITQKLKFCVDVGLDYLTLDRKSSTLSGGEAQRIHLATQVGSGLVGVLYVLDEPSIGLHQRDNAKLLTTLKALRDLGNTLVVVEHDQSTILSADHIVDLGPGAGRHGGKVIFSGDKEGLLRSKDSLTAKYIRKDLSIQPPANRRPWRDKKYIEIKGASEHNLKNIDLRFPLGTLICVTGVSGSGKSTLITDILYPALVQKICGFGNRKPNHGLLAYRSKVKPGAFKAINGTQEIDQVIVVDQQPIGRTPRSNPATYTGVFAHIRDLFVQLPEARQRGYKPGRFSFNVKGGRCESCGGDGIKKIEMHFLPDVYVKCELCKGLRFNNATLEVKYKGKSIADVLEMTVEEGLELFSNIPRIKNTFGYLNDVGLGYIQLGQSATTLSGGEAQRIKLSSELCKRSTGKTLYLLDEPTTGLHFADVARLISVLQKLVERSNTVVVVEHNLEVIKCADYIIDLGPEGGDKGGELVASCSPEELIKINKSFTAKFLREALIKT